MHDTRTPCAFLTPALEPQRKKHACVFTLSISGAFVEMLGILWFCSAQWRHLARNGSPDSSQLGGNMMNNAHLKPRIEPISELLLLVKPAASSWLPLDHEFPLVGSRVSSLGSTFTVEGFPTCQKCQKVKLNTWNSIIPVSLLILKYLRWLYHERSLNVIYRQSNSCQ